MFKCTYVVFIVLGINRIYELKMMLQWCDGAQQNVIFICRFTCRKFVQTICVAILINNLEYMCKWIIEFGWRFKIYLRLFSLLWKCTHLTRSQTLRIVAPKYLANRNRNRKKKLNIAFHHFDRHLNFLEFLTEFYWKNEN